MSYGLFWDKSFHPCKYEISMSSETGRYQMLFVSLLPSPCVLITHSQHLHFPKKNSFFFVSSSLCVLNTIMEEYKRLPLLAMPSLSYYYI